MTTQQDLQIMAAVESVYGTAVTPTRTVEFLEEDIDYTPTYVQGQGMRVGKKVALSARRTVGTTSVGGSFTTEGITKGIGWAFQAALGAGTSTLVTTGAFQEVFTFGAGDYLSSYTIQTGMPTLGGGAAQPHTYSGMVCSGFEISGSNGGIPTIKFNWLGKDVNTATALATSAYPTGVQELAFKDAQIVIGGTITAPTTTALAASSGTLGAVNIRDFDLTLDNGLDTEGFNFNGGGKRSRPNALGLRAITGTVTAEYTDTALEQAFLLQTPLSLLLTYQLPNIPANLIGTASYPTIQIAIPDIRLEGEFVKSNAGDVMTQSISFTGFDGQVAAQPLYVTIVTAETAI